MKKYLAVIVLAMALTSPLIASAMANPASVFCIERGGKLIVRKDANGGEYTLCKRPGKKAVEEWKFYRSHKANGKDQKLNLKPNK